MTPHSFIVLFRRFVIGPIAAAAILGVLFTPPLHAQATGTILGGVTDARGPRFPAPPSPPPIRTRSLRGARPPTRRGSTRSAAAGRQLQGRRHADGFKNFSQTGIVLEVGRNARVDATIEPGAVSEVGLGRRRRAARRNHLGVALADRRPERSAEPAARQPRPVLAAEHHRRRHQQRELELARRAGAADDDQRFAEGADRHRQLPARWRQQHGRPARHRQPGAESGSGAGVPRDHQQLRGRVRPLSGRRRRRRHEVGHEPVSRRRVRVLPQRDAERQALGAAGHDRRPRTRSIATSTAGRSAARSRRDKTFFFASYSGLRQEETYYRNTAVVPTALERAGDFSQSAQQAATIPLTGAAVPRRHHPVGALRRRRRRRFRTSTSRCPTCPTASTKSARPDPLQHRRGDAQARSPALGHALARGQLLLPEGHRHAAAVAARGNIPWVDRDFKWNQHNLNVADTWTLSPTMINQLRGHLHAAVRRAREQSDDVARRSELEVQDSRRSDAAAPDRHRLLHRTDVDRRPGRRQRLLRVKDSVSISRGNHSFKFGGEVSYEKIVHDTLLDNYGVFTFNGSKTGNAYADFLLGLPATMTQDAPVRKTRQRRVLSARSRRTTSASTRA